MKKDIRYSSLVYSIQVSIRRYIFGAFYVEFKIKNDCVVLTGESGEKETN